MFSIPLLMDEERQWVHVMLVLESIDTGFYTPRGLLQRLRSGVPFPGRLGERYSIVFAFHYSVWTFGATTDEKCALCL